jgi:hypothetical protein
MMMRVQVLVLVLVVLVLVLVTVVLTLRNVVPRVLVVLSLLTGTVLFPQPAAQPQAVQALEEERRCQNSQKVPRFGNKQKLPEPTSTSTSSTVCTIIDINSTSRLKPKKMTRLKPRSIKPILRQS